jgi:hypothetical protein
MKKIKILLPLIVIVALLLTTVPMSAASTQTPVSATEYVCLKTPGKTWMEGDILHVRGQINENVVVANGQVWGINYATIDYNVNTKTGQIVVTAKAEFVPLEADGGYIGTGFFRFFGPGNKLFIVAGNLRGYGVFTGQSIHLKNVIDIGPTDPAGPGYCAGHGQYFDTDIWDGYILIAGG